MNARTNTKMSLKKRAAVLLTATGIMLSMGSGMALAANFTGGDKTDDVLVGTEVGDSIWGLGKDDVLNGLSGQDMLHGGDHRDILLGDEWDDKLIGGYGNDRLNGGLGNDSLHAALDGGDRDILTCGKGFDRAFVDQFDLIKDPNSCEKVTVREAPVPAPEAPAPAPEV